MAPPATVYRLLADYHRGHPRILPERYFRNMQVEAGGTGAGTRIRYQVRAFGTVRTFRAEITEPEPGRRLLETGIESGIATTFTVEPGDDGRHSHVTIATAYEKAGIRGWLERLFAPQLLRTIYRAELRQLETQARMER
jgi:Polyketide cyclase / dehydrase and lipid transport